MQRRQRPAALRYGVAIVSVLAAFGLTLSVPTLRQREAFVPFFGAVMLSAWYGGRGPGLFACLLSAFLTDYILWPPAFILLYDAAALIPLAIFLVVSVAISSMTTSLARAEERAREQRQWLQVTLSSIGDAVIATDAQSRVTFMNALAERLTNWTSAVSAGKPVDDVVRMYARKSGEADESLVARALRERGVVQSAPGSTLLAQGGARIAMEGNAAPIKNSDGQILGVVLVFRDITERENAREKILDYQERLRSLASEVSLAEERERRKIANGLHDRIGQTLALSRIKLGTLRGKLQDPALAAEVEELAQLLKQMISEIRSLTFDLSPPILYEFGLEAALEWLAGNVHKQQGLPCAFSATGEKRVPLRQETSVLLFQAVRELLTNVVKHARAGRAGVAVKRDAASVSVTVDDDGAGFDASEGMLVSRQPRGFGLFSIRERVQHLGGNFAIDSAAGRGTRVTLSLPVAP